MGGIKPVASKGHWASVLLVFAALVGCASAIAGTTGIEGSIGATSTTDTLQRTVVHVDASGTQKITTTTITRAERAREIASRRTLIAARTAGAPWGPRHRHGSGLRRL